MIDKPHTGEACPKCHSRNVRQVRELFGAPTWRWFCDDCREMWAQTESRVYVSLADHPHTGEDRTVSEAEKLLADCKIVVPSDLSPEDQWAANSDYVRLHDVLRVLESALRAQQDAEQQSSLMAVELGKQIAYVKMAEDARDFSRLRGAYWQQLAKAAEQRIGELERQVEAEREVEDTAESLTHREAERQLLARAEAAEQERDTLRQQLAEVVREMEQHAASAHAGPGPSVVLASQVVRWAETLSKEVAKVPQ